MTSKAVPAGDGAPDPLSNWPAFASAVRSRLDAGRAAYGDRSFTLNPADLVREVQAELLDVCGWSYILFQRLEAIRIVFESADAPGSKVADEAGYNGRGRGPF